MFKNVVSYPNGTVVFFYTDKIVVYKEGQAPITWLNNNKESNGDFKFASDIWSSSRFDSVNQLYNDI